jgi:hypothetical protein
MCPLCHRQTFRTCSAQHDDRVCAVHAQRVDIDEELKTKNQPQDDRPKGKREHLPGYGLQLVDGMRHAYESDTGFPLEKK